MATRFYNSNGATDWVSYNRQMDRNPPSPGITYREANPVSISASALVYDPVVDRYRERFGTRQYVPGSLTVENRGNPSGSDEARFTISYSDYGRAILASSQGPWPEGFKMAKKKKYKVDLGNGKEENPF